MAAGTCDLSGSDLLSSKFDLGFWRALIFRAWGINERNNAKTEWEPATCLLLVFFEIHVGCGAAMPMAGLLFLQDHRDTIRQEVLFSHDQQIRRKSLYHIALQMYIDI